MRNPERNLLLRTLRREVAGDICADPVSRAAYAYDGSNYRVVPELVVAPATQDDLATALSICARYSATVTSRGAGTSLSGGGTGHGVVLDTSRYLTRILDIDNRARVAQVEAGVTHAALHEQLRGTDLIFAPDPGSRAVATIGGMIGTNAAGAHSLAYGRTSDNLEAVEVVTAGGDILALDSDIQEHLVRHDRVDHPHRALTSHLSRFITQHAAIIRTELLGRPRRSSGYNLEDLLPERGSSVARALAGSEGTLVAVANARLRLTDAAGAKVLLVLGYPSVYTAADDVPAILAHAPKALEAIEARVVFVGHTQPEAGASLLPYGRAWLLAEFVAATPNDATSAARRAAADSSTRATQLFTDPASQEVVWKVRAAAGRADGLDEVGTPRLDGWSDSAVPPAVLGTYLRDLHALYNSFGYRPAFFGHFGEGCVHGRADFRLDTAAERQRFDAFRWAAASMVIQYGGVISAEHGDGHQRGDLFGLVYSAAARAAMYAFKAIWDPDDRMNPGTLLVAESQTAQARQAQATRHPHATLARLATRCIGSGQCRAAGDRMCPSYAVTHDERQSPRGRARIMEELTREDGAIRSWTDQEAYRAMSTCLGCGACRTACPAQVDIPDLKVRFLEQRYRHRLRPASAYLFAAAPAYAHLASRSARAVAIARRVAASSQLRRAIGLTHVRSLPIAAESFDAWYQRRPPGRSSEPLMLFVDTWSRAFDPSPAKAAVMVLEQLGYRVLPTPPGYCCGRPFLSQGMRDRAARSLERTSQMLASVADAQMRTVVLEPTCAAALKEQRAGRKTHIGAPEVVTFAEVVAERLARRPRASEMHVTAVQHCHDRTELSRTATLAVFDALGVEATVSTPACCGMGPGFGYEQRHYQMSLDIGRQALPDFGQSQVVATGFSCRRQIEHIARLRPLHVSELVADLLTPTVECS